MKTILFFVILVAANVTQAYDCRNLSVKHKFDVMNGYPHGRHGYIVDHICPLAQGGIDSVENMQYQTIVDSHAKDRWENTPYGKKRLCDPSNSTPDRRVFNCKGD